MRRAHQWRIGSIAGAPIYLTSGWLVITAVVVLMMTPTTAARLGLNIGAAALVTLLIPLLLAFSVLLHELAHGYAAIRCGVSVREYVLSMWGGHTTFHHEAPKPGLMALIAVAGPLANGVIALVFWQIHDSSGAVLSYVMWLMMWTNLIVMAFNLLPASPLDGGKLLVAALWKVSGHQGSAMVWAGRMGIVLAAAMVGGVVWWSTQSDGTTAQPSPYIITTAILAMIMMQGAYTQIKQGKAQRLTANIDLWELAVPTISIEETESVAQVDELLAGTSTAVVLVDQGRPTGIVDPGAYRAVPAHLRMSTQVRATALMVAPSAVITTTQGSPSVQLVAQAARAGHATVILHDGTRPPALLRVRDLAEGIKDR